MTRRFLKWIRFIGILLFIWVAYQIDWGSIRTLLINVQIHYIFGYVITVVIMVLLKIIRLRWFLASVGYQANFKEIYQSVVEPGFYGIVTPARLGELTKVLYLIRLGLTQRQAWCIVILERLIDFALLLFASLVGALFYFHWNGEHVLWATSLFLILCGLLCYGLIMSGPILEAFQEKYPSLLLGGLPCDIKSIKKIGQYCLASAKIFLPFALIILALSFLSMWILGAGLGVTVSGFYLGVAYATASVIALIPITFAGLGTREATYILLLDMQGVAVSAAVAISLLEGVVLAILIQAILMLPLIKSSRNG